MTTSNKDEIERIREISDTASDNPVMMLNINRYTAEANYPNGQLYHDYMAALNHLLSQVGAEVLWRLDIAGQPVGPPGMQEVLAVWYPSHKAFLDLSNQSGTAKNFRLRRLAVEEAVIHRCAGVQRVHWRPLPS